MIAVRSLKPPHNISLITSVFLGTCLLLSFSINAQSANCSDFKTWANKFQLDKLMLAKSNHLNLSLAKKLCLSRQIARYYYKVDSNLTKVIEALNWPVQGINLDSLNSKSKDRLAKFYTQKAFYLKENQLFTHAIFEYKKANNLLDKEPTKNQIYAAKYINITLANIYTRLGDYNKSLLLSNHSLATLNRLDENNSAIPTALLSKAIALQSLAKLEEAIKVYKLLLSNGHITSYIQIIGQQRLASCYLQINDPLQSKRHVTRAIQLLKSEIASNEYDIRLSDYNRILADLYVLQAQCAERLGEASLADHNYTKGLDLYKKHKPQGKDRTLAKMLTSYAVFKYQNKEYNQSILASQEGLLVLFPSWKPTKFDNPSRELLYAENSISELLISKAKSLHQLYLQSSKLEHLENALECYQLILDTWDLLRETYSYESSELLVLADLKEVIHDAINVALLLHAQRPKDNYLQQAYQFNNRAKNLLLFESLIVSKSLEAANLPDSAMLKRRSILLKINNVEEALFQSKQAGNDADKLESELLDTKELLSEYDAGLEEKFPVIKKSKYQRNRASLGAIQAKLSTNEMILDYFYFDTTMTVFKITNNSIDAFQSKIDTSFNQSITGLRNGLLDYFYQGTSSESSNSLKYIDNSRRLYTSLLEPLLPLDLNLIIIPDGHISILPFEVLLTEPVKGTPSFKKLPYFIKDHIISYNYSSDLWLFMKSQEYESSGTLAFAPEFLNTNLLVSDVDNYRRNNLGPLKWNKEEVKGINATKPSKKLFGAQATVNNLENLIEDYSVLHIASHAKVDEDNSDFSFVAFSANKDRREADKFYIKQLEYKDLALEMVVLSACETGLGEIRKGDGVASLARGFAKAGAKSMITSLWEVSDKPTSEIMISFYEGLKQGKTKHEALRTAKLNYLEDDNLVEDHRAHPFFWAGFIAIGDMSPLSYGDSASKAGNWNSRANRFSHFHLVFTKR